jgi:hypothetical protein
MSSIHRAGLAIASLVTVATVAGAYGVRGYVAAQDAAATASPAALAAADPTVDPTLAPETIYVNPLPTPQIVQATQTAQPGTTPRYVHVFVPGSGGERHRGGSH